jgi:hypothetical protein
MLRIYVVLMVTQTAIISLTRINWLVFVMEIQRVFCEAGTEFCGGLAARL